MRKERKKRKKMARQRGKERWVEKNRLPPMISEGRQRPMV